MSLRRSNTKKKTIHSFVKTHVDLKNASSDIDYGYHQVFHPGKPDAGEDTFFINAQYRAIAVFDGIGEWRRRGIDARAYPLKLCDTALEAVQDNERDPLEIMSIACNGSKGIDGTSTACVGVFEGNEFKAANLGDSAFVVIRDFSLHLRSKSQQIKFNVPYQMGSTSNIVPWEKADTYKTTIEIGDVIVMGSDGLFDNLFIEDIIKVIKKNWDSSAQKMSKAMGHKAFVKSKNRKIKTPFSEEAKASEYDWPGGGKMDDITLVIARVKSLPPAPDMTRSPSLDL